jgi:integrase
VSRAYVESTCGRLASQAMTPRGERTSPRAADVEAMALQTGREITWLSKHLGHRTLEVTASTYGHWERSARKRQAEQMAGVFGV